MKDNGTDRRSAMRTQHGAVASSIAKCQAVLLPEFSWDEARVALTNLRENIEGHFMFEEEGGYLDELVARAPHNADAVAKLRSEHSRMRGELALLLAAALVGRSRAKLREDVGRFFDGLSRHEKRETALVQQVHLMDVGGGG